MALVAVWLTLTLVTSHFPWTVATSQNSLQVKVGLHHHLREGPLHKIKRDVAPVSHDYISNLWSDIESAFRFLEEQQTETPSRERSLLEDLQRNRKNEKINRLPFTQHNFIRFGKRSHQDEDTHGQSAESGIGNGGLDTSRSAQNIISSRLSQGFDQLDNQLPESSQPIFFSNPQQNIFPNMEHTYDNPEKREHNFVRIGKRYIQDDNPEKREFHNFVRIGKRYIQDDNPEKREFHNFVRIGKRYLQDDNPEKRELHNFVRIGRQYTQDDNPEKRELHNFVRIGKGDLQDNNAEKREHNFVRFGKRYIQYDNPEKKELHNFVRIGKRYSQMDNAEKRERHNFVRFGKRHIQDDIPEKRELHNFVRIGKRSLETDYYNTEKREHNFVRFGRTFPPTPNALPVESTSGRSYIDGY